MSLYNWPAAEVDSSAAEGEDLVLGGHQSRVEASYNPETPSYLRMLHLHPDKLSDGLFTINRFITQVCDAVIRGIQR